MEDMALGVGGAPDEALELLATEHVRAGLEDLDTRPVGDLVDLLLGAEAAVPAVLAGARAALVTTVELVTTRLLRGGRLIYVGAGTAGRIAALDAVECRPTFGVPEGTVVALVAGGPDAVDEAFE